MLNLHQGFFKSTIIDPQVVGNHKLPVRLLITPEHERRNIGKQSIFSRHIGNIEKYWYYYRKWYTIQCSSVYFAIQYPIALFPIAFHCSVGYCSEIAFALSFLFKCMYIKSPDQNPCA